MKNTDENEDVPERHGLNEVSATFPESVYDFWGDDGRRRIRDVVELDLHRQEPSCQSSDSLDDFYPALISGTVP